MDSELPDTNQSNTNESTTDQPEGMSLGLRTLMGFSAVIVFIVLYVLSVGPIGLLYEQANLTGTWGGTIIELFYFPLSWLYDNTTFAAYLDWYLELWGTN